MRYVLLSKGMSSKWPQTTPPHRRANLETGTLTGMVKESVVSWAPEDWREDILEQQNDCV